MRLVPRVVAGLLLLTTCARAQTGPLGTEFQANTNTTVYHFSPAVAADATGRFVVVWVSGGQDGTHTSNFGQRFDANGMAAGVEFQIETFTTGRQHTPSVASDAAGNFVVTWTSGFDSPGQEQDGHKSGIFGQRFDTAGTRLGGEFQVNSYTTSWQYLSEVARNANGDFVVVWQSGRSFPSETQDGDGLGVFAQHYDGAGTPLGAELQVNTYTTGDQRESAVAIDTGGNFVVVWASPHDGGGFGVFARRFDSTGAPLGAEFQVNTYTTGSQGSPAVAMDPSGGFVVTWSSDAQDGDDSGVFAQRYDSAGTPAGNEFRVNGNTAGFQGGPRVACDGAGGFLVAWTSRAEKQDGDESGVFARRYDATGMPIGDEVQVNTYTFGTQVTPVVAADGADTFVVAWGSVGDVYGKRLATAPPVSGKLRIRDDPDATKRKLTAFFFFPASTLSVPDFDPVANGAFLHVFNPATGLDSACMDLPASGWTTVGVPSTSNFIYRDPSYANGPCRRAVVRKGRSLQLLCKGQVQPLSYNLDEPMQGAIDVRFGSGAIEYCTEFGSKVTQDDSRAFGVRRVDTPVACGRVPVSCP